MATRIFIITTDDKVYATEGETICFKEHFTNEGGRDEAIQRARATAFGYALGSCYVYVNQFNLQGSLTDEDIFNYLENY